MTRPNGITGAIGKASALNGRPERSVAPRVGGSERDGGDLRLGHPTRTTRPGRRSVTSARTDDEPALAIATAT